MSFWHLLATTNTSTGTYINSGTDSNINITLQPSGGGGGYGGGGTGGGGTISVPWLGGYAPPMPPPSPFGPPVVFDYTQLQEELQEAKDYATELEMELSTKYDVEDIDAIEKGLIARLKSEGWKEPG
jgi:hypothetical protein